MWWAQGLEVLQYSGDKLYCYLVQLVTSWVPSKWSCQKILPRPGLKRRWYSSLVFSFLWGWALSPQSSLVSLTCYALKTPSCSVTKLCPTLWDPMDCSTPGFHVLHHLPEFARAHVHLVGDAIQQSHPLSSPSPPALWISQHQGLFKWVSSLQQVAKVLEFQLQHQSFQWIFRVDFFRIDWFDLFAIQETLKSLFQYHSSKASILQHSAFFIVQLSHIHT